MAKLMTPGETASAIERKLADTTGRTLEQWVELVHQSAAADVKAAHVWLKTEHEVGHFQAMTIARAAFEAGWAADYANPDRLLDQLFSGSRAKWRGTYEHVMLSAVELGSDVRVSVCKTYASAYRARQFVVLQPKRDALVVKLVSGANQTLAVHELTGDHTPPVVLRGLKKAYQEAR